MPVDMKSGHRADVRLGRAHFNSYANPRACNIRDARRVQLALLGQIPDRREQAGEIGALASLDGLHGIGRGRVDDGELVPCSPFRVSFQLLYCRRQRVGEITLTSEAPAIEGTTSSTNSDNVVRKYRAFRIIDSSSPVILPNMARQPNSVLGNKYQTSI
jgi:hypothetical protein